MSLTETEKKTAVFSASDLLRPGSLSWEFECKVIFETRIFYFISYLIMTPIIFLSLFSIEVLMKEKLGLWNSGMTNVTAQFICEWIHRYNKKDIRNLNMCTYFFSVISSYLVIDFSFYNFCLYIRGLGQNDSEHSVISDIISGNNYWVREQIRAAFKQSGFANESAGYYKLLPCEFGTYVNTSAETIKCIECPAGKFIRSLWKLHNYIVGIICLHC